MSHSDHVVEEKIFKEITSCCKSECFRKIEIPRQRKTHHQFCGFGDYQCGNVFSSSVLKKVSSSSNLGNLTRKSPQLWKYFFSTESESIEVCKQFLCSVLNINEGRIKTVQNKILNEKPLADERGKHLEHETKLTEDIQNLILLHCESLPHSESHYDREHTELNYFHDSSLTLVRLYNLFLDYYSSVTGNLEIPVGESAYSKFFNHNIDFSFSLPRADVCDLCFEYENLEKRGEIYENHRTAIQNCKKVKEGMMKDKDGVLHCVFDFAQNLPLPKLPVNCQFYCRLLWLQIFNVHILNSDTSYMFHFIEGMLKKGANTVCNLLYHALRFELQKKCCNKIFLYSDAAGSQNRNYLMVLVLSMLSQKYEIFIEHLYPVRGHSYCECDRNFGRYGHEKKMREVIEIPDEYIDFIKHSRDPPFTMIDASQCEVKDFDSVLLKNKEILQKIKISSVVKIDYFPNGELDVHYQYHGKPLQVSIKLDISFDNLENAPLATGVGITPEKMKDLQRLQSFLSLKGRIFHGNFCKTTVVRTPKIVNVKTEKMNKEIIVKKVKKQVVKKEEKKIVKIGKKIVKKEQKNDQKSIEKEKRKNSKNEEKKIIKKNKQERKSKEI